MQSKPVGPCEAGLQNQYPMIYCRKYLQLATVLPVHSTRNHGILPSFAKKKLLNPEVRAIIPLISEKIYALVKKYNGSMTAEHNDGLIRTPYLPFMFGKDMVQVFEKTKHLFDPQGIFNPGKKVGGTALRTFLREGDVALLKGSQGLRMEQAVEQAMEHPGDAVKLLCRQSEQWRAKPYSYL
jgi:hypothetical protein